MSRRERVYEADVEALEARLRELLAAGRSATDGEITRYETGRERVLDLIGDQMREQRDYDAAMARLRAEMQPEDGADGWVSEGHEAAHQAHLDSLGHVDAATEAGLRQVEAMINAPYRRAGGEPTDLDAVDLRISEVHDGLLADNDVEPWTDFQSGDARAFDDAGDQR